MTGREKYEALTAAYVAAHKAGEARADFNLHGMSSVFSTSVLQIRE